MNKQACIEQTAAIRSRTTTSQKYVLLQYSPALERDPARMCFLLCPFREGGLTSRHGNCVKFPISIIAIQAAFIRLYPQPHRRLVLVVTVVQSMPITTAAPGQHFRSLSCHLALFHLNTASIYRTRPILSQMSDPTQLVCSSTVRLQPCPG